MQNQQSLAKQSAFPASTDVMLDHRLRRCPNITSVLAKKANCLFQHYSAVQIQKVVYAYI